jgi:hypothetical protein
MTNVKRLMLLSVAALFLATGTYQQARKSEVKVRISFNQGGLR